MMRRHLRHAALIVALSCAATPTLAQEVVEDINVPPPAAPKLPYRFSNDLGRPFSSDDDPLAGLSVEAPLDAQPPAGDDIAQLDKSVCYIDAEGRRLCFARPESQVFAGVNYYPVVPGSRPWQAQTFVRSVNGGWQQQHWCGGVWLGEGWVLTAAHCTRDGAGAMHDVRVRLGAFDLSKGDGALYRIDRVVVHAGYKRGEKPNDIALLHVLQEPSPNTGAPVNDIAPIPIMAPPPNPRLGLKIGEPVHTTGWGRTSYNGPLREILGETELRLTANAKCKAIYGEKFSDRALCAYADNTDSCEGDSGGPLTIGHEPKYRRLIGIVSFGRGCAVKGVPGVYTRIDAYYDWIGQAKKQQSRFIRLPDPVTRQSAR